MKNKLRFILYLIAGCLMTACGDSDNELDSTLHIAKSNIDFTATGGVVDIAVEASNDITAVSGGDWCRVIEITNEKVTIMARTNTEYAGRATRLTISDGINTEVVTVTQQGDIFAPETDKQTIRLGNKATVVPIEINSSFGYTVGISNGTNWIKVNKTDNGFAISLDENTTGSPRAGIVRVKSEQGRYFDYTVYQYELEQLLGEWRKGALYTYWTDHIIDDGLALTSAPVTISRDEEGGEKYTLAFPLENTLIGKAMQDPAKATLRLHASYKDGAFVISTLQAQEDLIMLKKETITTDENDTEEEVTTPLYGASVLIANGTFSATGDIGIAPILYNGQLFLSYVDVATTPGNGNAFLSLCFFSDREFTTMQDYILFAGLEIYR